MVKPPENRFLATTNGPASFVRDTAQAGLGRESRSSGGELLVPAKRPTVLLRRREMTSMAGYRAILPRKRAFATRRLERPSNEARSPNAPTIVTSVKFRRPINGFQAGKQEADTIYRRNHLLQIPFERCQRHTARFLSTATEGRCRF
jgi:hypothetical protein